MQSVEHQEVLNNITNRFQQRTQGAREADARAKQVLPGGDTRSATYYPPYPAYMERGEGCFVYDYDENRYFDFLNNYTSLIHGHAHPQTVQAIGEQAARGTALGSAGHVTLKHAELLCARIPSLETVRYCNSGTEATLLALRAARAFTGRDLIVKMDGGYHGSHDFVQVNVKPDLEGEHYPHGYLTTKGVPEVVLAGVLVVPFNDLKALGEVLVQHGRDIAAIIMEPILGAGGGVAPLSGYLQGVRELAHQHQVLLILDEIVTFRLAAGGVQSLEEIRPDLTTLGKIIGGGLPVGAFGGRREIMAAFDPQQPQPILHNGTFNGNNLTMAAGLAALLDFDTSEVKRINGLGQRLKKAMNKVLQAEGVKARAVGSGSIIHIHWRLEQIQNARQATGARLAAKETPRLLHLELLNQGIFCASRLQFAISTPMSEMEIDTAVAAWQAALQVVKPYMVEEAPHLLIP